MSQTYVRIYRGPRGRTIIDHGNDKNVIQFTIIISLGIRTTIMLSGVKNWTFKWGIIQSADQASWISSIPDLNIVYSSIKITRTGTTSISGVIIFTKKPRRRQSIKPVSAVCIFRIFQSSIYINLEEIFVLAKHSSYMIPNA